jgi:hypothetical protein
MFITFWFMLFISCNSSLEKKKGKVNAKKRQVAMNSAFNLTVKGSIPIPSTKTDLINKVWFPNGNRTSKFRASGVAGDISIHRGFDVTAAQTARGWRHKLLQNITIIFSSKLQYLIFEL